MKPDNLIGKLLQRPDGTVVRVVNLRHDRTVGAATHGLWMSDEWDDEFDDNIEFNPNTRPYNEAYSDWMRIWRNQEEDFKHQLSIAKNMGEIKAIVARADKARNVIYNMGRFKTQITMGGVLYAARLRLAELVGFEMNSEYGLMLKGDYATPARTRGDATRLEDAGFVLILRGERIPDGRKVAA